MSLKILSFILKLLKSKELVTLTDPLKKVNYDNYTLLRNVCHPFVIYGYLTCSSLNEDHPFSRRVHFRTSIYRTILYF